MSSFTDFYTENLHKICRQRGEGVQLVDFIYGWSPSYSPVTVTVNLHLALFPEGSVDDTNTVVVPIFTLMGRRPPIAHAAGEDSTRGRNPELSGNSEMNNDVMRLIRRIDHQCIVCQIVRHSARRPMLIPQPT